MTTSILRSNGAALTDGESKHYAALVLVRAHIATHYRPGQRLPPSPGAHRPTASALSRRLGVPEYAVLTALRTLNSSGEIEVTSGNPLGPRVLGPNELHVEDVALHSTVRQRLLSGHYGLGHALPTGLLGEEFTLRPEHVARALRRLVAAGWLKHDLRGPYGAGYYVTGRQPRPTTPKALAPGPDRAHRPLDAPHDLLKDGSDPGERKHA